MLPIALNRKFFQAFVLPHADYCAVVWQECTKELQTMVERILNYGTRLILSQPPRTPSGNMRHTLHWMPLERQRTMFHLILMHRCINQPAPAYLNKSVQRNCTYAMLEQGALITPTSSLFVQSGGGVPLFSGHLWSGLPFPQRLEASSPLHCSRYIKI